MINISLSSKSLKKLLLLTALTAVFVYVFLSLTRLKAPWPHLLLMAGTYFSIFYGMLADWKKIREIYSYFAITLLTISLCCVFFDATAFVITEHRKAGPRPRQSPSKIDLKALKEKLLGLSSGEMKKLWTETWNEALEYAPWVQFREKPRHGKYVNVHKDGYRIIPGSPENPKHLIFLFGGSTTFGYNVTDNQTFSYYLQAEINKNYPEGCFAVRNYGRAYYYSGSFKFVVGH